MWDLMKYLRIVYSGKHKTISKFLIVFGNFLILQLLFGDFGEVFQILWALTSQIMFNYFLPEIYIELLALNKYFP